MTSYRREVRKKEGNRINMQRHDKWEMDILLSSHFVHHSSPERGRVSKILNSRIEVRTHLEEIKKEAPRKDNF